jgi:hypothetical protein
MHCDEPTNLGAVVTSKAARFRPDSIGVRPFYLEANLNLKIELDLVSHSRHVMGARATRIVNKDQIGAKTRL